ncbi:MAG TPA: PIN domain-containing protein [Bacteroidales bacterium]|nr:PIN domain-containing protein [Bacteroidales bacterium]HRZ48567.1 PIN domain-containing protein [Bacteroidales bacterium]
MKDRVFLDTNVVLDLLGERISFYASIARIASLADRSKVQLVTSAISFPTLYYLLSKYESPRVALEKLRKFRLLTDIAELTDLILDKALNSTFTDFEDALQYYCALSTHCNIILTRDFNGFKGSALPVMTPDEYLAGRLGR